MFAHASRAQPKSARVRPIVAKFGHLFDHYWSSSGKRWPNSGRNCKTSGTIGHSRPDLGNTEPKLATTGKHLATNCQTSPTCGQPGPNAPESGCPTTPKHCSAIAAQIWSKVWGTFGPQVWPCLARFWLKWYSSQAASGQTWSTPNRHRWADVDHLWPPVYQMWADAYGGGLET